MIATPVAFALIFSKNRGPWTFFSDHLGCVDLRLRRQKNNRAQMIASPATPPTTPPTMLPMFASPLVGSVRPPSDPEVPCSGPMIPAATSPEGNEDAGAAVGWGCAATGVLIDVGCRGVSVRLEPLGSTASGDWRMADSAAPEVAIKGTGSEDGSDGSEAGG
jgi:hypothetical protein